MAVEEVVIRTSMSVEPNFVFCLVGFLSGVFWFFFVWFFFFLDLYLNGVSLYSVFPMQILGKGGDPQTLNLV